MQMRERLDISVFAFLLVYVTALKILVKTLRTLQNLPRDSAIIAQFYYSSHLKILSDTYNNNIELVIFHLCLQKYFVNYLKIT